MLPLVCDSTRLLATCCVFVRSCICLVLGLLVKSSDDTGNHVLLLCRRRIGLSVVFPPQIMPSSLMACTVLWSACSFRTMQPDLCVITNVLPVYFWYCVLFDKTPPSTEQKRPTLTSPYHVLGPQPYTRCCKFDRGSIPHLVCIAPKKELVFALRYYSPRFVLAFLEHENSTTTSHTTLSSREELSSVATAGPWHPDFFSFTPRKTTTK